MSPKTLNFGSFHHPTVRDIVWVATSDAFFNHDIGGFSNFDLEIDPTMLLSFCQHLDQQTPTFFDLQRISRQQYRRLGLYFEALLQFLFLEGWRNGVTPYQMREHNVQISGEHGNTVGEIDLLLQHRSGELIHVEAAVKYYLALNNETHWTNWIGPNARDRLDIKMERLLHHQLPLLNHQQSRELVQHWREKYKQHTIASQLFMHGVLFRRPAYEHLPEQANKNANQGYWCRFSELALMCDYVKELWICRKLDWLGGPDVENVSAITLDNLINMIQNQRKIIDAAHNTVHLPLMCYFKDSGSPSRLKRLIIVNDHWPE